MSRSRVVEESKWRHLASAILIVGAVFVSLAGATGDVEFSTNSHNLPPWCSAFSSGPWPAVKDLCDAGMAWLARGSPAQSTSAAPVLVARRLASGRCTIWGRRCAVGYRRS
jgi:hypothetical protein